MATTQSDVETAPPETSSGGSVPDQAKQQAQRAKEQAVDKAGEAKEQVQSKLRSQIEERKSDAATKLNSTLQDVRSVGEELRKQGKDGPARVADQVAERGDKLASYLDSKDADELLREIEDYGRRNPWAVIAGGVVVGFAASRFLRASSQQRSAAGRALPPRVYGSGMPADPPRSV